jgi:hypothetical protein
VPLRQTLAELEVRLCIARDVEILLFEIWKLQDYAGGADTGRGDSARTWLACGLDGICVHGCSLWIGLQPTLNSSGPSLLLLLYGPWDGVPSVPIRRVLFIELFSWRRKVANVLFNTTHSQPATRIDGLEFSLSE